MMRQWPCVLIPQGFGFYPSVAARFGPQPLGAPPQRVVSGAGHWRASMPGLKLYGKRIAAFRALIFSHLDGGVNAFMMPSFDRANSPVWLADAPARFVALRGGTPFSDDATFSDGTMFGPPATDDLYTVAVAAARGATTLQINLDCGVPFRPCFFGLGTGDARRLYYADWATPLSGDATKATVKFWPPLRAAASAGDGLEIDTPSCPVVMTSDPALVLDQMRTGSLSLDFAEIPW